MAYHHHHENVLTDHRRWAMKFRHAVFTWFWLYRCCFANVYCNRC